MRWYRPEVTKGCSLGLLLDLLFPVTRSRDSCCQRGYLLKIPWREDLLPHAKAKAELREMPWDAQGKPWQVMQPPRLCPHLRGSLVLRVRLAQHLPSPACWKYLSMCARLTRNNPSLSFRRGSKATHAGTLQLYQWSLFCLWPWERIPYMGLWDSS